MNKTITSKTYTAADGRTVRVSHHSYLSIGKRHNFRLTGFRIGERNGSPSGLPTGIIDDMSGDYAPNLRYTALTYGQEIADQIAADIRKGFYGDWK